MNTRKRIRTIVDVHLLHQSSAARYENVRNTYQKGSLFCVMLDDGTVHKFPINHIFRVTESKP